MRKIAKKRNSKTLKGVSPAMDLTVEEEAERNEVISVWEAAFRKATDFDLWGQPIEATDCYLKLAAQMTMEGSSSADAWLFSDNQKKVLNKITICLETRSKSLRSGDTAAGISLEDLKKIEQRLGELLSVGESPEFPVKVSHVLPTGHGDSFRSDSHSSNIDTMSDDEGNDFIKDRCTLLHPIPPVPGQTALTVRIEKIGLKEGGYIDPFITVSVKDITGATLCPSQDTPVCKRKGDNNLFFGVDVHIQQLLETFPSGFALFFELKHFKPKKRKTSVKCWAFMEKDEIKEGPAIIEIYKKPTDFRRKKLHLLTVKPLYLYLKLSLY